MPDAARVGDEHACAYMSPAHVGGPIVDPCSPNVDTNGVPQARAAEPLGCMAVGETNFSVTGSGTVEIAQGVASGRGVITPHQAGALWGTNDGGFHAVQVTGLVYNKNGELIEVIY